MEKSIASTSIITRSKARNINFTTNINPYALGSTIVEFGNTKVHITATCEDNVPKWLKGHGQGWITAEYSMLPGSTHTRSRREKSKISGRSQEIQRLIARSLRSICDLKALGERLITIDCDVLVADGGTRTASISGGYVALAIAINSMIKNGVIQSSPLKSQLAAISIGISQDNNIIADLNYKEDSTCNVDMNIVMNSDAQLVELQGTAEGKTFSKAEMNLMLDCAENALSEIFAKQKEAISNSL